MIAVVQYILGLGATVMLPIIIFLIGTLMGAGVKRSLKSGIIIGVGFVGIDW